MNDSATPTNNEKQASEESFQVTLKGLHPSASPIDARAKLAALFKASAEQVDRLISTHGYVLKKGCSLEVATKYRNAIEATGAICEVESEAKPIISLDADLPELSSHPVSRHATVEARPSPESTNSDNVQPNPAIDAKWRAKFDLLEKAGGPKLAKIKDLSFGERLRVVFNVWGFLFGPFYYAVKGMWKKGISLTAVTLVAIVVLERVLNAFDLPGTITNFVGPAIFATRANIDYYKKTILGENGWW